MEDGGLVCCGDEADDAVADDAVDGRFVEGDGTDSCFNEEGVVEVCLLGVFRFCWRGRSCPHTCK